MNDPHAQSPEELAKAIGTDLKKGLSEAEASERLRTHGPNELPTEKTRSPLLLFLKQFQSGLVYILIGAAAISFVSDHSTDGFAILLIILINATVGFVQERRAETAIDKLRQMVVQEASVMRDGRMRRIPAAELVPGDIILFEEGDRVVADARLCQAKGLVTNESALTGESVGVAKDVAVLPEATVMPDRHNMAWMGTSVLSGQGTALVVETGPKTTFGKIATSLRTIRRKRTPFETSVDRLGRNLGLLAVGLSAAVFVLGYFRGFPPVDTFFFSVAMAVSVIPEGLPAVLVVVLAIGVQRMARRNAVVRHLPSVETLGATDVICTDKTGTLTENKMTVRELITDAYAVNVTGEGWETSGDFTLDGRRFRPTEERQVSMLITAAALCTRASLEKKDDRVSVVGDPTEVALVVAAAKAGMDKKDLAVDYPLADEIPFSSERKFRAVLVSYQDLHGKQANILFVVGALEVLAGKSGTALVNGDAVPLDDGKRARFDRENLRMAEGAMRVLAVGMRAFPPEKRDVKDEDVADLTFLGLVGMIDPPRTGVAKALAQCREAGIRVIMLTGDHKETAIAIGKEIGLIDDRPDERVFTDTEVSSMGDDEFKKMLRTAAIFARVRPETKLRIVGALQEMGHVVAMTGDGVNDAPALKKAEIGIAMGIAGTDVSREVADMVLADDNFVSIVNAVEEGRVVFRNFKQTTAYLFITNMGEAATILASLVVGLPLPLLPAQILWLNVVTDGFCDIALATERTSEGVLSDPPRKRNAHVITRNALVLAGIAALLMALGTLLLFESSLRHGSIEHARSVAFVSLALFQLWNVFNMRSVATSIFRLGFFSNIYVVMAVAISFILQLAVLYFAPLQRLFKTVPISLTDWLTILAVSSSVLVAVEGYKVLIRREIIPKSWT